MGKNFKFVFWGLGMAVLFFSFSGGVEAANFELTGYAWSENIGWVSFSSRNCDIDGDGAYEGAGETGGPAPTGCPVSGAVSAYRVTIDETTGKFSGYAWSENIGWINFTPSGPYPTAPSYSAKIDFATNEASGWARVLANGGGWSGWIKLRGLNYGVSLNAGAFEGYAWSDMVIGWLSFKGPGYGVITQPIASPNQPPDEPGPDTAYGPDGVSDNNCSYQDLSLPTFHWIYSDPEGDSQGGYEIKIEDALRNQFTCGGLTCSGNSSSQAFTPMVLDWANWSAFGFNKTFYWTVRVRDSLGAWSAWMDPSVAFSTPAHAYPWPDFTWSPTSPGKGEQVKFKDQSVFSGGPPSWQWNFGDGLSSSSQNPSHSYANSGNYNIILRVIDGSLSPGYCDSAAKEIKVKSSSGSGWKEISPF